MAKTQDLSTALSEAQEWLDFVSTELNNAYDEYERHKDSDDLEEIKAAMESMADAVDRVLARIK